ncbi:MFS transporter [Candidatus Neomarinimicrobiota bacterium]
MIIFTPLITAVTMSLLGVAPHYVVIAILLLVMGVSSAAFHVPAPVMVKGVVGNRIGKGMSFYMLGGEIARTLSPLVILAAVSLWELEGTWRLIPFAIGVSLFLYFKLRKIEINMPLRNRIKTVRAKHDFIKLIPLFALLGGIVFFRAGMKSALTVFLPTYMSAKGNSLWIAGASLSVIQFTGAAGTLFSGTISDIIGRKYTLLFIAVITPVLMWFFIVLEGIYSIPLLVILGFFLFAPGPVLLALVQDIDSEHQAFINGFYIAINFVINSVAIMLIGLIGDSIGLELTYKLASVSALVTIPLVLILR